MKKAVTLVSLALISLTLSAQTFQLNFSTFQKYLADNYSPDKVKTAVSSEYTVEKQGDTEWKFKNRSESWQAIMYVQFDQSTKKIKEIQFTVQNLTVYTLMNELEKTLGYKLVGSQGQMDIYENKVKNLGVKIVSTELFGKGVTLLRIYRL